jgi:UrcA family protein
MGRKTMTRINKLVLIYSLAMLASAAGSAAHAGETDVSTSYRPYELQSAEGTKAVYRRIRRAAANACRDEISFTRHQCREDLMGQFLSQIASPALFAVAGRGKRVQLADRGG